MSSLRATDVYPSRRTERLRPLPTEAFRPRLAHAPVPVWCERVDEVIRVVARIGYSPTPTILLISTLIVGAALRHG